MGIVKGCTIEPCINVYITLFHSIQPYLRLYDYKIYGISTLGPGIIETEKICKIIISSNKNVDYLG